MRVVYHARSYPRTSAHRHVQNAFDAFCRAVPCRAGREWVLEQRGASYGGYGVFSRAQGQTEWVPGPLGYLGRIGGPREARAALEQAVRLVQYLRSEAKPCSVCRNDHGEEVTHNNE